MVQLGGTTAPAVLFNVHRTEYIGFKQIRERSCNGETNTRGDGKAYISFTSSPGDC